MRKAFVVLLAALAASLAGAGTALAADTTVVVTPAAPSGWVVDPDGTVPYAFAGGAASLGDGSLQFGPIDGTVGANKFILIAPYSGPSSELTGFSYDFYVDRASPGGAAAGQHFYVNVYVDDSGNGLGTFGPGPGSSGFYDCRYDLVPPSGVAGGWATQSFGQATPWTNVADRRAGGCPTSLGGLAPGSEVLFVVVNGGQSTSSDAGVAGAYDNVVITTPSGTTTYDFEPASDCATSTSGSTITLLADCTVTSTFVVPDGYTLDGDGHTIAAVDPAGGAFLGAVVGNAGDEMHVVDLTVDANGAGGTCHAGLDRLAGIRFVDAGGSVSGTTVQNVLQSAAMRGCQEGNAIEVRNAVPDAQVAVTIADSVLTAYQKTGVVVDGNVAATIVGNTVTGLGPVPYIAQNGIQVSRGATALVERNTVSGNAYTEPGWTACGLLFFEAAGVKQRKNTLVANQQNLCNVGRGGGQFDAG